jgi:hypothetical protein
MKRALFLLMLFPVFAFSQALSGTYHVGAAQPVPFKTITTTVAALNSNGISGPVTLLLDDSTYSNATGETFPITFNSITGSSATNTITIKPNTGVNVSVEASNINNYTGIPAVIKFNGTDNIIIDGSNETNGTTRNLTFNNKDNITHIVRTVIWVASVGSNNGATNIKIKNSNIRQANKNAGSNFCVGVYSGANNTGNNGTMTVAVSAVDNTNLNVSNNNFINVKQGIYINGGTTATTNVVIHQNDLGAENNTETIIQPACLSNVNGFEYTENLIYNLYRNTTAGSLVAGGIYITGNSRNGYILKNQMRDLIKTETDSHTFAGITLASSNNNANIVVANNFILNVSGYGNSDAALNGHGINVASGGGYKIYNNTVKLQTNQATAGYSSALYVNQGVLSLDVRNNIFINLQTSGTRRTAIMVKGLKSQINSIFSFLDYNDYYSLDQLGFIANANSVGQINWPQNPDYLDTLQEWKTTTGKDANSVNVNPEFTSTTNLHLTTNNFALDNLGTPLAAITKDIDGQIRNTSTPDMGADEFGAVQLPSLGSNTGVYCASSTTWNGTAWSNGTPTAEKDAIFIADFEQDGGIFTSCSIFVEGTAKVLFEGNSNAYVTHNVNVASTAFLTFESGSNLIQIENTQNVGNVMIKRFGSNLKKLDYTFWSSPVTGTQKLQEFSPATLSNRFYTYNTATNTYLSVTSPSTTTFTTGRGYLIRMPNSITGPQATAYNAGGYRFAFEGIFTGVPNNGNVYVPLVYNGASNNYNGVGNPYPSPISVTDFIDANIDNIEGTIWVWRKDNNPNETSYGTITKMGYTANSAPGGSDNGNGNGNDLIADPFSIDPEGVLNTGQGFIVKAKTNQDLVFRNNMRKSNNYANFFKNPEPQQTPPAQGNSLQASRIWLNVTNSAEDVFSQTLVGYTTQATFAYDNGIDGKAFVDGNVCLYSVIQEEVEILKLAIQGRPAFNDTDIVPLGFKTETAGEFIIELDHVNGLFSGEQEIYIKDNVTGVTHNIKESDYTFTSEVGTYESRFEVVYMKGELGTGDTELAAQDVVVYRNAQRVGVQSPEEIKSITIYDVQGKIIYQNNTVNSFEFVSSGLTATQQMLIVSLQLEGGQVVSKKIMMN